MTQWEGGRCGVGSRAAWPTSQRGTVCWLHRCWLDSCIFVHHKTDFDSILHIWRWHGQPCLSAPQAAWNSMLATQMLSGQLRLCPTQAWLWQHTTQMMWTALSLHHKPPGTVCWLCRCWPDSCSLSDTSLTLTAYYTDDVGNLVFCITSRLEQHAGYTDDSQAAASLSITSWTWTAYYADDMDSLVLFCHKPDWNSMLATQMMARQLRFCPSQASWDSILHRRRRHGQPCVFLSQASLGPAQTKCNVTLCWGL